MNDLFEGCLLADAIVVKKDDLYVSQCNHCRAFIISKDFDNVCNLMMKHYRDIHKYRFEYYYKPDEIEDNKWLLIFDGD